MNLWKNSFFSLSSCLRASRNFLCSWAWIVGGALISRRLVPLFCLLSCGRVLRRYPLFPIPRSASSSTARAIGCLSFSCWVAHSRYVATARFALDHESSTSSSLVFYLMCPFHRCVTIRRVSCSMSSSGLMRTSYLRHVLYPVTSRVPITGKWSEAPFGSRGSSTRDAGGSSRGAGVSRGRWGSAQEEACAHRGGGSKRRPVLRGKRTAAAFREQIQLSSTHREQARIECPLNKYKLYASSIPLESALKTTTISCRAQEWYR